MTYKYNLVIVDAQKDFIDGSLAVDGAKEAIDNVIKFIRDNNKKIGNIVCTIDWHPINHCSFENFGGKWPVHCVNFTNGASIYKPLSDLFVEMSKWTYDQYEGEEPINIGFATKGEDPHNEEYGAFELNNQNEDVADNIEEFLDKNKPIILGGLCGDYCIMETAKNLIKRGYKVKFLLDGIASIDGGTKLNDFIREQEELAKITI